MEKKRGRPPGYKITLTLGEKVYISHGRSILEALKKLERPEKITTKSSMVFEGKGNRLERNFLPFQLKMFLRPIAIEIMAKQIATVIK